MAARRTILIFFAITLFPAPPTRADRIVLRNLDMITDKTVEQFDEDGVVLDNGDVISWDRIEKGRVDDSRQTEFDKMLADLGSDLYRIRQRLSISDYRGLLPHAEAVYPRYAKRRSETAYMVFQALMWSRLAVGQREAALQPYLDCIECLRWGEENDRKLALPGARRLKVDLQTGLSPELPPVWFDAEASRKALDGVAETISGMVKPRPPATRVYYATLALTAGETDEASQTLAGLNELPDLKMIIEAQMQLSRGEAVGTVSALAGQVNQLPSTLKPLAFYWLGKARVADTNADIQKAGLLDLLRIPALHGKDQPELAAAGLYTAMNALAEWGDMKESIAIRRELLDRYGQTWHAERLRGEDKKAQRHP